MGWRLKAEILLPAPIDEVFAFFADARNLERITPGYLRFEVLTPAPVEMREGAVIDYRLKVRGVPLRWRSEIVAWDPPSRFVDEQRRGPYAWWKHEHRFEARDGSTLVQDHVYYGVPGGPLAPLVHALLVRRDVRRIFECRGAALQDLFGREPEAVSEGQPRDEA